MISTPFPTARDSIVNWLTQRQYVRPHDAIGDVLSKFCAETRLELAPVDTAGLNPTDPIGRLKRAPLESLAIRLVDSLRN